MKAKNEMTQDEQDIILGQVARERDNLQREVSDLRAVAEKSETLTVQSIKAFTEALNMLRSIACGPAAKGDANQGPQFRSRFLDNSIGDNVTGMSGPNASPWAMAPRPAYDYRVWQEPLEVEARYSAGVVVGEGVGGKGDDSVIVVNRIGKDGEADIQVAVWRSNSIPPTRLAQYCDSIGRQYNTALMCVERNRFQSTVDILKTRAYPNLYRPRDTAGVGHGWATHVSNQALLRDTFLTFVHSGRYVINSEATHFGLVVEPINPEPSHELRAAQIALFCAHETEVKA